MRHCRRSSAIFKGERFFPGNPVFPEQVLVTFFIQKTVTILSFYGPRQRIECLFSYDLYCKSMGIAFSNPNCVLNKFLVFFQFFLCQLYFDYHWLNMFSAFNSPVL